MTGLEELIGPETVIGGIHYSDGTVRTWVRWSRGSEWELVETPSSPKTVRITAEDGEVLWEAEKGEGAKRPG